MDLLALSVKRVAREGHPVFPADEAADLTRRRIKHLERASIAEAVNHSLMVGGNQFPVLAENSAVGADEKDCVVERSDADSTAR